MKAALDFYWFSYPEVYPPSAEKCLKSWNVGSGQTKGGGGEGGVNDVAETG